jgi:hypothetical protein
MTTNPNPIATWPAIETELPKLVPGMTSCRVTHILESPVRVRLALCARQVPREHVTEHLRVVGPAEFDIVGASAERSR